VVVRGGGKRVSKKVRKRGEQRERSETRVGLRKAVGFRGLSRVF
jgi:hypothetical protein